MAIIKPLRPLFFDGGKAEGKISALFEFSQSGKLTGIYLNARNSRDQDILERALGRLIKPPRFEWLGGLFR